MPDHFAVKLNFIYFSLYKHALNTMEQAAHQILINDIETLLATNKGVDESKAKTLRKKADALIKADKEHALHQSLAACLEKLRERVHKQTEKRDKDYELVLAELKKASQALKAEKLKDAESATQKALSIAGQIPGLSTQRRATIDKLLDQIYPRMRKLSAWRHWGTTQARENSIDQMKLLVDSRLEPNKIANAIRDAKTQWRDWEQSGDHSEHKLWKAFSDACDAAYAPCKPFFEAQKTERKQNLEGKRALIEEINLHFEKTDWQQPNWKEIDKWLRQAKGKFYKIGHTDYKHHKKLKVNLEKALDQFETHLSRERARSLKARQKLIEDVLALDEVQDVRAAITQLDQLKKQWGVTVLEKRGVENKLWDKYQKAQDQIYAKRNQARKEEDQTRNENLKQKRLIVEQLIKAAGASKTDLLSGQSQLAQHKDQFNEIGYVPRKAEKALMDSWRKAQKQFQAALSQAQKSQIKNAQTALLDKARLCASLEQKQLKNGAIDSDKAKQDFDAITALSAELETAMKNRFKHALNTKSDNISENTHAQLHRCLKLEVMLDLPTPDAYAKDKMAFQIERLNASMKKANQAQDNPADLKTELLTTGPIAEDQFNAIWARIDTIFNL